MSDQDLESKAPASEWLVALQLDPSHRAPPSAKARVWGRVQTDANLAAGHVGPQSISAARITWLTARSTRLAVATFLLGTAAGAGLHAWLQHPPRDRSIRVDSVDTTNAAHAPGASVVPPTEDFPAALPAPRREELAPPRAPRRPVDRMPDRLSDLAAERALLDRAQRALRAGNRAEARRALEAHTRRFPAGNLVEEREALSIKLLVAAGRTAEAQSQAARFRARFPDSLFDPDFRVPETIP